MTEKEINAYKKITAPNSIKERLIAENQRERKKIHTGATICYAIAAAAAMVVLAFTFFWNSTASLYLEGENIGNKEMFIFEVPEVQMVRAFSASRAQLPLKIETNSDTEIKVSNGVIFINGEEKGQNTKISKDTEFIWMFEASAESNGYTLEVNSKKEQSLFEISKKEGTERFYIKKVK